jgi:hypothetical protein
VAGISDIINGLTPEERQQLLMGAMGSGGPDPGYSSAPQAPMDIGQIIAAAQPQGPSPGSDWRENLPYVLGGAAAAMAPYLGSSPRPTSTAQALAAMGGGATQGLAEARKLGIADQEVQQRGQYYQTQADALRMQQEEHQAKLAAAAEAERQRQAFYADPKVPQSQKDMARLVENYGAKGAAVIQPPPEKAQIVGDSTGGYYEVTPGSGAGAQKVVPGMGRAPPAPPAPDRELVAVVGKDGKPILVPRAQAPGMQPYVKGDGGSSTKPLVINDKLVDPVTHEVLGDYGTPKPGYQRVPIEKNAELGLPEGVPFQVSPDGKYDAIVSPRGQSPFGQTKQLRDAYEKNTAPIRIVAENAAKMKAGFEQQTGQGDVAGIFAFMKVLDPGSVVREGEYATAANAGSNVPNMVLQFYNKAINGERLTNEQRSKMYKAGLSQLAPYKQHLDSFTQMYGELAKSHGLKPEDVLTPLPWPDMPGGSAPSPAAVPGEAPAAAPAPTAAPPPVDNLDWVQ